MKVSFAATHLSSQAGSNPVACGMAERRPRASASAAVLCLLMFVLMAFAAPQAATAQTYSWGTSGAGGTGTWNTSNTNWWNGSSNVQWQSGTAASFGGIAGVVTVSGSVTIGDITFATTGYSVTSGTLGLSSNTPSTIHLDTGLSGTIGSLISGTSGLRKTGSGTLTLSSQASTYRGTQIDGGTVIAIKNNQATVGPLGSGTFTNVVTINSGTLTGTGNNWLDLTSVTSGANAKSIIINAGGMLAGSTGNLTGLGNVTLSGGTIEVSSGLSNATWNGSFLLGGDITVTGSTVSRITTRSGAAGSANIQMSTGSNSVGGTRTFTVNDVTSSSASDLVVSARMANGTVIKAGAGTLELAAGMSGTGTPVNWQVNAGTLLTTTTNAISTGTVTVASGATLDLGGQSGATAGGIVLAGSLLNSSTVASASTAAVVDLNGLTAAQLGGAGSLTLSGVISNGGFRKVGSGVLTLGSANTYTGATTISSGTVVTRVANAISGSSPITIGSADSRGFLKVDDSLTISSLTFTGSGGDIVDPSNGLVTFLASSGTATVTVLSGSNRFHANATLSSPTLVDVSNNAYFSFQNNLSGGSSLTKSGAGKLTLTGNNTFAGPTTVDAGILAVNGSLGAGDLSVATSAMLMGSGSIGGATTIMGTHSPGNSPGIQTFASNLSYAGGSSGVIWELWNNTTSNSPLSYDQIIVNGNLDFTDATSLSLSFGGTGIGAVDWNSAFWDTDQTWTLFDVAGTTSHFSNFTLTNNPSGWVDSTGLAFSASSRSKNTFTVSQQGGDALIRYTVVVPEPASLVLAGIGIAAAAWNRFRKRAPSQEFRS